VSFFGVHFVLILVDFAILKKFAARLIFEALFIQVSRSGAGVHVLAHAAVTG